jgi:hypothetical protein
VDHADRRAQDILSEAAARRLGWRVFRSIDAAPRQSPPMEFDRQEGIDFTVGIIVFRKLKLANCARPDFIVPGV